MTLIRFSTIRRLALSDSLAVLAIVAAITSVGSIALPMQALGQSPLVPVDTSASGSATVVDLARRLRIVENLKLQIPQLRESDIVVTQLQIGSGNLDEGLLIVAGQQQLQFVVTKDDKALYLLAAPPIDVSKTSEEIAALLALDRERELAAARARHERLLSVADGLPSRGNPDADVVIFEFSDFQCPYCASAAKTVHDLLEKHSDEFRLVYMHLPLNIHPWAQPAALASACVASQNVGSFWALHDFYFDNQSLITADNIAEQTLNQVALLDVDVQAWNTCVNDPSSTDHKDASKLVDSHVQIATEFRISGTPAFYVNGEFINGAKSLEVFEQAIARAKSEM